MCELHSALLGAQLLWQGEFVAAQRRHFPVEPCWLATPLAAVSCAPVQANLPSALSCVHAEDTCCPQGSPTATS